MLDYKDIIIKHYDLGMSGREIARTLSVSKTGVNSFLNAFKECKTFSYLLPEGMPSAEILCFLTLCKPPQSHIIHRLYARGL